LWEEGPPFPAEAEFIIDHFSLNIDHLKGWILEPSLSKRSMKSAK
jgi:hypothetical protein